MFNSIILIVLFVVSSMAFEYLPVLQHNGIEYVPIPISRVRRQTAFGVNSAGLATLSHTGILADNNRNHVTGTGFASKQFNPNGPLTLGGSLDYLHKPSGSTLNLGASNTRGFGTDVSATGRYNFYNNGRTSAFAEGQYSRHFGGPFGTGRPNYYGGVGVIYRF